MRHEAVVVGGGMVGAAAALAMQQAGIDCALLEHKRPARWNEAEVDLRVSAISPASEMLFESLGVWGDIVNKRVSPFDAMRVWEQPDRESLQFSASEFAIHRLGHIVENSLIVQALWQAISPERVYQTALVQADRVEDGLWLQLEDGREIRTRLLIGADGVASQVRELAGIAMPGAAYDQQGLVCHVRSKESHQNTAWQRFLSSGPLALLPLSDGRCSIVWSLDNDHAEQLQAMNDAAFSAALTEATGARLGNLVADTQRASFPLARRHAATYSADRIVLIGDAAHVVHPLAGQGGNLGLLDAATLTEELSRAIRRGIDPGHASVLGRYARRRRADNAAMLATTDALQRMFASQSPWVEGLRRIGLGLVDKTLPAKNALIRHAMYGPPDAPALMRPQLRMSDQA